jgi:hypothetical protein
MNISFFDRFRIPKKWLRLALLMVPVVAVLIEFSSSGLARKTFVFYDIDNGAVFVEDRLIRVPEKNPNFPTGELDLIKYTEDALLGPVTPNSLPLFPKETRLRSLLYRDGTVYADLSEDAVLPPAEGGEVFTNLKTLRDGIKRNFPFVGEVRFFIAGKPAYGDELRRDKASGGGLTGRLKNFGKIKI